MTRKLPGLLPLVLLTGLAGCGGGGGGGGEDGDRTANSAVSSSTDRGAIANTDAQAGVSAATQTASPLVFPVQAVMAALVDYPHSYVKTYKDPANDVHTLVGKYAPGVILDFEDLPAKAGFTVTSRSKNGTLLWMNSQVEYYEPATYRYLGAILDTGEYIVAGNHLRPPATARVGDSGNLYTFTSFTNNTKATVVRTATATWELQPDTESTAYLCTHLQARSRDGSESLTSACNKVGVNSLLSGSKMIITAEGNTATFID